MKSEMDQNNNDNNMVISKYEEKLENLPKNIRDYVKSLSENDRKKYLYLLKKNQNLRQELKTISEATENILIKEKEKKAERRKNLKKQESNQEIRDKRKILNDQQKKITHLKKIIKKKKKKLKKNNHKK